MKSRPFFKKESVLSMMKLSKKRNFHCIPLQGINYKSPRALWKLSLPWCFVIDPRMMPFKIFVNILATRWDIIQKYQMNSYAKTAKKHV